MTDEKTAESIERVLFNPHNGKLAVGFRLRFMDKYTEEAIAAFQGNYSLRLEPTGCDAWAIDNEDGIHVVVPNSVVEKSGIEDWGPL